MKLSDKDNFRIDFSDGSGPAGYLLKRGQGLCFMPKYPCSTESMKDVIKIIDILEKEIEDDRMC